MAYRRNPNRNLWNPNYNQYYNQPQGDPQGFEEQYDEEFHVELNPGREVGISQMMMKRFQALDEKMARILTSVELMNKNAIADREASEKKMNKAENIHSTNTGHQMTPMGYVTPGGVSLSLFQQGQEGYFPEQCYNVQDGEEANYAGNYQGQRGYDQGDHQRSYQLPYQEPYQQPYRQQGQWRSSQGRGNWSGNQEGRGAGSSQQYAPRPPFEQHDQETKPPSKLEDMMSQALQNQLGYSGEMKDMRQTMSSHSTSLKELESRMNQLAHQVNSRPQGALPSDTIVNPKISDKDQVMAIKTRSGKTYEDPKTKGNDDAERRVQSEHVGAEWNANEAMGEEMMQEEEERQSDVIVLVDDDDVQEITKGPTPQNTTTQIAKPKKTPLPKENPPNPSSIPKIPLPFPQRSNKQREMSHAKKIWEKIASTSINIPLVDALGQMPSVAKFMKDLVTKKTYGDFETIKVTHQVSAIVSKHTAQKMEDPGAFTIPCTIGGRHFKKALCDLGASINLMPYAVYKTLDTKAPRPTTMNLQMADRSMKSPIGIIDNVLVKVDKFVFPADFVILDCPVDFEVPIILGRPFLATGRALCDVERGELTFRSNGEKAVFHICKTLKQHMDEDATCSYVDVVLDGYEGESEKAYENNCLGDEGQEYNVEQVEDGLGANVLDLQIENVIQNDENLIGGNVSSRGGVATDRVVEKDGEIMSQSAPCEVLFGMPH